MHFHQGGLFRAPWKFSEVCWELYYLTWTPPTGALVSWLGWAWCPVSLSSRLQSRDWRQFFCSLVKIYVDLSRVKSLGPWYISENCKAESYCWLVRWCCGYELFNFNIDTVVMIYSILGYEGKWRLNKLSPPVIGTLASLQNMQVKALDF